MKLQQIRKGQKHGGGGGAGGGTTIPNYGRLDPRAGTATKPQDALPKRTSPSDMIALIDQTIALGEPR